MQVIEKSHITKGVALDRQGTVRAEQGFALSEKDNVISFGFCLTAPLVDMIAKLDSYKIERMITIPNEQQDYMNFMLNPKTDFIKDGHIQPCWMMDTKINAHTMRIMEQSVSKQHVKFQSIHFDETNNFAPHHDTPENIQTIESMKDILARMDKRGRRPRNIVEINYLASMQQNFFTTYFAGKYKLPYYAVQRDEHGDLKPIVTYRGDENFHVSRTTAPMRDPIALTMWLQIMRHHKGKEPLAVKSLEMMRENMVSLDLSAPSNRQRSMSQQTYPMAKEINFPTL